MGFGAFQYLALEDVVADEVNDMYVVAAEILGVYKRIVELQLSQFNYISC